MANYRKKPVVIEATQWHRQGDNPHVTPHTGDGMRWVQLAGRMGCGQCGVHFVTLGRFTHGWIDTLEGGHIVCPDDWIITGVAGERYPCKPDIFDATYEAVPAHADKEDAEIGG